MSRKLKHRELKDWLQEILTRAQALHAEIEGLCIRANTDMDDGFPVSSLGGGSRTGHGDPVGTKATGRPDDVGAAAEDLRAQILAALKAVRLADKRAWGIRALTPDEARILSEKDEIANRPEQQTIQPHCANNNCQRLVARTREDPLRGGRCDACRKYLDRNGVERPKTLCDLTNDAVGTLGLDADRLVIAEGAA